jgi:hypothetical protein
MINTLISILLFVGLSTDNTINSAKNSIIKSAKSGLSAKEAIPLEVGWPNPLDRFEVPVYLPLRPLPVVIDPPNVTNVNP